VAPIRRLALVAVAAAVGVGFGPTAEAAVQTLVFKSGPVTVTPYDAITRTARFMGTVPHDVTLASGPFGFSSPWTTSGGTFSHTFTRPGTYKFFCSLHPARMTQVIQVRKK